MNRIDSQLLDKIKQTLDNNQGGSRLWSIDIELSDIGTPYKCELVVNMRKNSSMGVLSYPTPVYGVITFIDVIRETNFEENMNKCPGWFKSTSSLLDLTREIVHSVYNMQMFMPLMKISMEFSNSSSNNHVELVNNPLPYTIVFSGIKNIPHSYMEHLKNTVARGMITGYCIESRSVDIRTLKLFIVPNETTNVLLPTLHTPYVVNISRSSNIISRVFNYAIKKYRLRRNT